MMDALFAAKEARRVAAELRQLVVNADVIGEAADMLDALSDEADQFREALQTILANTEEGAIKHRDYDHLAKDIADTARAALEPRP